MAERLRPAGRPLIAIAVLAVLHAAFSTYEYLSTLKALGRHTSSTALPTSIFIEALSGLLLFLIGTTLASAPLQDITYRGELAKRSLEDLDTRMGLSPLSARSRALFGDSLDYIVQLQHSVYSHSPNGPPPAYPVNNVTSVSASHTLLAPVSVPSLRTMSLSVWAVLLAGWIPLCIILWACALPLAARALLGDISSARLTPTTARCLEWRRNKDSVLPTLRVERAYWSWGGGKNAETGILVLTIVGVSLRLGRNDTEGEAAQSGEKKLKKSPGRARKIWSKAWPQVSNLLIQHYPAFARLISIRILDTRLIFDDLNGLECTVEDIQVAGAIKFKSLDNHAAETGAASRPTSPMSAAMSPGPSPTSLSSPSIPNPTFLDPFNPAQTAASADDSDEPASVSRYPRFSQTRRKATKHYVRVTSTASQVFARLIGRAEGSMHLNISLSNVAIILPHGSEASAPPSKSSFPRSASIRSLPSFTRKHSARFSADDGAGFSTLASITGLSRAALELKFQPGKEFLSDDDLKAELGLAAVKGTVGGLDRIMDLAKQAKTNRAEGVKGKSKEVWDPAGRPRKLLRAMAQAKVSIESASLLHHLPKRPSRNSSASSSATDITLTPLADEDVFTLSADVAALSVTLSSANSNSDDSIKRALGNNPAPESQVRGIGCDVQCASAAIQCSAPGAATDEKVELVAIQQVQFDATSTWRPAGWFWEALLFAEDPNNSLVAGTARIDSVEIAADLPLVRDLRDAVSDYLRSRASQDPTLHPHVSSALPAPTPILPPRIQLLFVIGPDEDSEPRSGSVKAAVTDSVDGRRTTVSMSSDGCRMDFSTSHRDIVGRRKLAEQRRIFDEEAEVQERRREDGALFNAALPNAMLRPRHRRNAANKPAVLRDNLSFRIDVGGTLEVKPIEVQLSLEGPGGENGTYDIASVGRIIGSAAGSVAGQTDVAKDGSDLPRLDMSTRSISLELGIEKGIQLSLWQLPVITALTAMGEKRQQPIPPLHTVPPPTPRSILDKLPAGISLRLSLPTVSAFVGHPDPNPDCKRGLTRGLWMQSGILIEHAYYTRTAQYPPHRCVLFRGDPVPESVGRTKLHLPDDVTAQAIAHANKSRETGGRASLTTVLVSDLSIHPIYNGEEFDNDLQEEQKVLAEAHTVTPLPSRPRPGKGNFKRYRDNAEAASGLGMAGAQINKPTNPPDQPSRPMPLDPYRSQHPILRLSQATFDVVVEQSEPDARTSIEITVNLSQPEVHGDMSRVYCALVAHMALHRIFRAWKQRSLPRTPTAALAFDLRIDGKITGIVAYITFPLHERVRLDVGTITVDKPHTGGLSVTAARMLLHVRSPRVEGKWEELARFVALSVSRPALVEGKAPAIAIAARCFRLRIPFGYILANLILNVNVSVKSLTRLLRNFRGGEFWTKHQPRPELPKRVPNLRISIEKTAVEAMDDPFESRLKLVLRAGMAFKERMNSLEDTFKEKMDILLNPEGAFGADGQPTTKLTTKATVALDDARKRLDQQTHREWRARVDLALKEEWDRETAKRAPFYIRNSTSHLDIDILESDPRPPLFRILWDGVNLDISTLTWSHNETVQYMSDCSLTPFRPDVEFSLMVPLNIKWTMESASFALRDYPLPLVRIRASNPDTPAWSLETPFIIAEEYHGPETWFMVPTEILPADIGGAGAAPLTIEVFKTISPVKTYTQPIVKIQSDHTSEFAWGNSYQPAIQDMMKVMDTISHSPKDPSGKPGFWDKFRLILQWRIQLDFTGPVHLHTKGSSDPYSITGHGAGFAFAWRNGTRFRIGYPNGQYELIQAESEELMVVIPDLSTADDATVGADRHAKECHAVPDGLPATEITPEILIQRQYTKPCARFMGGIRIGFGFRFERACRPWNCTEGCGETDDLLRRQCRFFDFKPHQDVILRNAEAVKQAEHELGHKSDSFEGFRSDYIHFSISCVSTETDEPAQPQSNSAQRSSLHFSPKASSHFAKWWNTFNGSLSLPIRKGALFPDSPPPSKKFGRHLATIKYRMDLSNVDVSHVYNQVVEQLWHEGKSEYLGVKMNVGRIQADGHQRLQQTCIRHSKLNRVKIGRHKVFYAVDILLDQVTAKGIIARYVEAPGIKRKDGPSHVDAEKPSELAHVSDLPAAKKRWFDPFDYIDADRKPFDHNPMFRVVDLGDCPQISFGKRDRAQAIDSQDDDIDHYLESDLETTKFGHEETHICRLGQAPSVAKVQIKLAETRLDELLEELSKAQAENAKEKLSEAGYLTRARAIKSIQKEIDKLQCQETRHMGDETLQPAEHDHDHPDKEADELFRYQLHIHCPKIIFNNTTRELAERYIYSRQDRVQEDRMTAYSSLRDIRQGLARIMQEEWNRRHFQPEPESESPAQDLEVNIGNLASANAQNCRVFRLPSDIGATEGDRRLAVMGIPADSTVASKLNITLFKPQIVLRSEADEDSVVVVAVQEISFRGYDVNDVATEHRAVEQILSRNYVYFKGLQAFYPTEENARRSKAEAGSAHSLDFLPLEIFLDEKNEATNYHRIISKADAGISVDKFNRLRLPRGVEWPVAKDDNNMPIEHLRIHQDMYNVVLPRLTVTGTSKHFAALQNIVIKLLMYQDARHAARSKRIDSFLLAFDRKDRDPQRTIEDLGHQQRATRQLNESLQWYEANLDELTEEDKTDLFYLRNEHMEHMEQLFTVFDAISVATKRERARASQVHSARVNIMAGGIAWAMLLDDLSPLMKFDIDGTVFSYISNKDGSTDQALRINDLSALNPAADAWFSEVFTRLNVGGTKKGELRKAFISAAWSVANPVGGIPIVKESRCYLHPMRIALEERIADQMMAYVFPPDENKEKEKGKEKSKKGDKAKAQNGRGKGDTLDLPPLTRSTSGLSIASMASSSHERSKGDEKFTLMSSEDAEIMRKRANSRNFHSIEMLSTVVSLSFKNDVEKKRKIKIPNCADVRVKTPLLRYNNKILDAGELFDLLKSAFIRHAWSQTGSIIGQAFTKSSVFGGGKVEKRFRSLHTDFPAKLLGPSKLHYDVLYPVSGPTSPTEEHVESHNPLKRVLSRKSPRVSGSISDGMATSPTSTTSSRRLSVGREGAMRDLQNSYRARGDGQSVRVRQGSGDEGDEELAGDGDTEGDGSGEGEIRVGRVKGFLGRLGRRKDQSVDDLNTSPVKPRSHRTASSSSIQTPMAYPSYH